MGAKDYLSDTEPAVRHLFDGLATYDSNRPPSILQYVAGLQAVTGATPDTLTYYYLRQDQRISFPGGDTAIQAGKERALGTAHQLQEDSSFLPKEGTWCQTCSFQQYCPKQREHPAPVPQSLVQARLPL